MKILLSLFLTSFMLCADTIYIVSKDKMTVEASELKKFFLNKTEYLDGKLYHISINEEALDTFSETVYEMSARRLSKQWVKQNFRKGVPFPKNLDDDAATLKWIQSGAKRVGFVKSKPSEDLILYRFER